MISTKVKFYILRKHVLQNFPNFIIKSFSIVQRDKISERKAQLNFSSKIAFVRFSIEIKNKTFTKKKKKRNVLHFVQELNYALFVFKISLI